MAILCLTCVCTLRCTSMKLVIVRPAVITSIEIRNRVRRRTRGKSARPAGPGALADEWNTGSEEGFTGSTNELIPHSVYRPESHRARWVFLQFLAEFQNVIIHGSRRGIILVSPDLVQQFVAADDPLGILHQELKCLEFLSRQYHRRPVAFHFHLLKVSSNVVEADDLCLRHDASGVAQGCSDPGQQFSRTERLGDVVISPQFEQQDLVRNIAGRTQTTIGNAGETALISLQTSRPESLGR